MSATYHRIIRKLVIGFGSLFDNITLTRYKTNGAEDRKIKVPVIYSPKEKYVARLLGDPELNKKVQITLPRMSFDLLSMEYDASRKQITNQKITASSGGVGTKLSQYNPVPYNFEFSLYIYVRNIEDGTQIIEHILPFFTPEYTIKLNLVPTMGIVKEVPIILNSVNYNIEYEGLQDSDTRVVIWTLNFTAKAFVYGSITENSIIRQSIVNILQKDGFLNTDVVTFNMSPEGIGTYKIGETIYQGFSLDTATCIGKVVSYNSGTNQLTVEIKNGFFTSQSLVIGVDSSAEYMLDSFTTANSKYAIINVTPDPANTVYGNTFNYYTTINEFPFTDTNISIDDDILNFSSNSITMDST